MFTTAPEVYLKLLTILLTLASQTAFAKPTWKLYSELEFIKEIRLEEDSIKIEDWVCTVGKINYDKFKNESRRLGCSVDGGLQVYINPVCSYDKKLKKYTTDGSLFNLQMKRSSSKMISLSCD